MTTETEFGQAIAGLRATGASASASEVVRLLDRHGREESALLARYEHFADEPPSPVAGYLVRLIVEDERRHHRIMEELANTIAWSYVGDEVASIPPASARPADGPAFRSETRALLRHEQADRRQLRVLRRRLARYGDVPLWRLLVDLMRLDTEKHIAILRFLLYGGHRRRMGWWRVRARMHWHQAAPSR